MCKTLLKFVRYLLLGNISILPFLRQLNAYSATAYSTFYLLAGSHSSTAIFTYLLFSWHYLLFVYVYIGGTRHVLWIFSLVLNEQCSV